MRYAVTGGAGFIGSNVVGELLARGHQVTVVDDFSTGHAGNLEPWPQALVRAGDVRSPEVLDAAMAGADAVVHLAASVGNRKSIEDPHVDASRNVLGTIAVLEAMRRHGTGVLVLASSAGIFGEPRYQPVDEAHPCEPDSPYGATKLCAEKLALAYMKLHRLRVSCLRFFNVFGPNQRFDPYGNVIPVFATRIARGEPLTVYGDGEQTRDFVSVRSVARATVAAAEREDAAGPFNVGTGRPTSINRLVAELRAVTGRDCEVVHAPPRPGDVRHCTADTTRLAGVLGIRPQASLAEELADYWSWFNQASLVP
jgi:UDP-glucose 4-epimerase